MTRVEFLTELDRRLSALTKEQADEYLAYYAEILADRMEDGMSEDEAVASLESPSVIAGRILGTVYTTPKKKSSDGKWFSVTALAICAIAVVAGVAITALLVPLFSFSVGSDVVVEEVIYEDTPLVTVDEQNFRMDTDGITALDISWISGNINFEFWNGGDIEVFGYGADSMTCVTSGNTLYINYDRSVNADGSSDLLICLPHSFAQAQLDSLRINTTSADVYLYDFVIRDLAITTISGMVDAYGCFDTVSISSTSGDVTLHGSAVDMTVDSISGYVYLTCDHRLRTLQANTVSGDLSVFLPIDLGFDLEFSSVSGFFSSGSLDAYDEKQFSRSHGDRTASIMLHSTSGNAFLELE